MRSLSDVKMQNSETNLKPGRWFILPSWESLPEELRTDAIRPYYDALAKHKAALFFKRLFDIFAALDLIILLGIPMLIIAIMIKCDSKGPVFFRQERVTTYGAKFRIHKFRTMVNNADKIGTAVTVDNDSRITKVGAKLRDLRLDEFPQLFDVLAGNMSFVGTRPEVVKYVVRYTDEMNATLLMPAGITSIASIEYKDEAELLEKAEDADEVYVNDILPEKMKWNLKSVKEFGFFKDIGVLFKTVGAVLK